MDRRNFMKNSVIGIGGILLIPSCTIEVNPYEYFTKDEASCIIAISEQIIPKDENGPGATYAGVIYYIDKQLSEVFIWEKENYMNGIKALQLSCAKLYEQTFEKLDNETQIKILCMMEENKLPGEYWKERKSSDFFNTIIAHTKQGFYGAPRHGGNKNYISYRLMEFEYPQVIGQNRYRGANV